MLAGFEAFDPPTEKKLAAHPDLPQFASKWGNRGKGATPATAAIGDTALIMFYYLLRVGEITVRGKKHRRKRTQQFRISDVTFFRTSKTGQLVAMPSSASAKDVMEATAATLRITDQKNKVKGACVHHESIKGNKWYCPVQALARRVCHIKSNTKDSTTMLCAYFDDAGEGYVTDSNIRQAVKFAGGMLNYPDRGIPIDRLDTHSLRTGGACALKLAGYDDVTIRKMGRWKPSSNVFLEYIQHQLSSFSHGMSKKMATIPVFTNMEGAVTRVAR